MLAASSVADQPVDHMVGPMAVASVRLGNGFQVDSVANSIAFVGNVRYIVRNITAIKVALTVMDARVMDKIAAVEESGK